MDNLPNATDIAWYQSTRGPQISATVKGIVGLLLPTVQQLFHISTGIDTLDRIIDALFILGFGGYALYGYVASKKALLGHIDYMRSVQANGQTNIPVNKG